METETRFEQAFSKAYDTTLILLFILASWLSLAGCGSVEFADENDLRQHRSTEYQLYSGSDDALVGFAEEFLDYCVAYGDATAAEQCGQAFGRTRGIRFSPTPDGTGAMCRRRPGSYGEKAYWYVDVNPKYRTASPELLRWLVIHELGHCALDLPHAEGGIMDPVFPSAEAIAGFDFEAEVSYLFQ